MCRLTGRYISAVLALLVAFALVFSTPEGRATGPARAQDDAPEALAFFVPVQGELDDSTPQEDYTFDGYAGQVISVIAVTLAGDLDPVVRIINPGGRMVGENDDIDSLVRDAGLEAFALPDSGTYTIRVMRYQGATGTTSGTYELRLTPGFGRVEWREGFDAGALSWVSPQGDALPLSSGGLRLRVNEPGGTLRAFPPDAPRYDDLYVQADARLFGIVPYAEFGLVLRAQGEAFARGYVFRLNTEGQWSVALQDETGEFVLRSWEDNPALEGDEWRIGVLARGSRFDVFANETWLGTVTGDRLSGAGTVGLYAASARDQDENVTVIFDDVIVTTRLGTTYAGLPLALNAWDAPDPAEIIAELQESGHLTNPADTHDLFLTDKTVEAADPDALFELIGSGQAIYDNFVLGARVRITTEGNSIGCGLVYRWQDDRNLDLAYVDARGGFGIVQAREGTLTANVYDIDPMVDAETNKLLVLARGGTIVLYINGALVAQERVGPGSGRVGVALLNYEDVPTTCLWTDIWVWPLLASPADDTPVQEDAAAQDVADEPGGTDAQ